MVRNTDLDWSTVAEQHPYWGVLSQEQFRGQVLSPEHQATFFASGEKLIHDILAFVNRHISATFRVERALDFGCGVGRLLIPLARLATEAVGVDVAPKMLELARANLVRAGISNATVVVGDDSLSNVTGKFNFLNSYITLQHIPPERGVVLVTKLLNVVKVGGVFSLQLTYAKERRFLLHEQGRSAFYRRNGNTICDLVSAADQRPQGTITMFDYDLNEIMLVTCSVAGEPVMILPTNHDGHRGVHIIAMKAR